MIATISGTRVPERMYIAKLMPDFLPIGGVERICLSLAEDQLVRGNTMDLVLMTETDNISSIAPDGLNIVYFRKRRLREAFPELVRYLRICRPNILLASMWPITCLAILANFFAGSPAKVIISDHNPLSVQYAGWGRAHRILLSASIWLTYRFASARVAVSNGVARDVSRIAGLRRERFHVIYNPVPVSTPTDAGRDTAKKVWGSYSGAKILAVGRLKPQKNFEMLLSAFTKVAGKTDARLVILGTGQLQRELEVRIGDLSLEGKAFLVGHVDDTAAWYETADLFVLSSDYEGYGNVLVEALAAGLPIVSTNCPSGPAEILDNGTYGMLVPVGDADAFADAILEQLSRNHSPDAQRRRMQQISGSSSLESYDALFREVLSGVTGEGFTAEKTSVHAVAVPSSETAREAQRTSGAEGKR